MTDGKVYVFLPQRRNEEVISLLLKIKELSLRLDEAQRLIDEQENAINGIITALKEKKPVVINDRETRERFEFDLSETLPTVG